METVSTKKFWMVWLDASWATKVKHLSLSEARKEANRIACLPDNIGRKVYVFESIDCRFIDIPAFTYVIL